MLALHALVSDAYEIVFYANGVGARRLDEHSFSFRSVHPSETGFHEILLMEQPSWVVTSASSIVTINPAETMLWRASKHHGIRTLAFLDQWQNYLIRFSTDGKTIDVLPDFINSIDEIGRREMLSLGFEADRLCCLGQPYLQRFSTALDRVTKHPEKAHRIGFVSEPIRQVYGLTRGYDQYDALALACKLLSARADSRELILSVKMHPKESLDQEFVAILEGSKIKFQIVEAGVSPLQFLASINELYGMTSIMLIQAYLAGMRTVSVQPGGGISYGSDPLVLTRFGKIELIRSETLVVAPHIDSSREFLRVEFNRPLFDLLIGR